MRQGMVPWTVNCVRDCCKDSPLPLRCKIHSRIWPGMVCCVVWAFVVGGYEPRFCRYCPDFVAAKTELDASRSREEWGKKTLDFHLFIWPSDPPSTGRNRAEGGYLTGWTHRLPSCISPRWFRLSR